MQIFGSTIRETKKGLNSKEDKIVTIARIVMSFALLVLAVLLIFNPTDTKSIGEFLLGAIVGYWLK